jgi:hypothetical protein
MTTRQINAQLQETFRNGYNAGISAPNPYLASSRSWEAFELGRWMHQTGRMVDAVRPSRGDTWKTSRGLLIRINYETGGKFHFTRES